MNWNLNSNQHRTSQPHGQTMWCLCGVLWVFWEKKWKNKDVIKRFNCFFIHHNTSYLINGIIPFPNKLILIDLWEICSNSWNDLKNDFNHCGPVTPYADIDVYQHWLRKWLVAWRHQAITWTNFDSSSKIFCGDQWDQFHKKCSRT